MKPKLIDLPEYIDKRGNLSFVEEQRHIPFSIKRVFYFYNTSSSEKRGSHAHYLMEELLIAVSGHLKVRVFDGRTNCEFELISPAQGLYIPPLNWREIYNLSDQMVGLALVSTYFDEKDYIRDYAEFLRLVKINEK